MKYKYKSIIKSLSNDWPTCALLITEIRQGLGHSREGYIITTSPQQPITTIYKRVLLFFKSWAYWITMGVLASFRNATFVFAPLAPPLAHRKNVGSSDNDGCNGCCFDVRKRLMVKEIFNYIDMQSAWQQFQMW